MFFLLVFYSKGFLSSLYPFMIPLSLLFFPFKRPALKNIYLLEFHPSLGLISLIPKALDHILQEFQQICRPKTASEAINLENQILQLAVDIWLTMESPESFYASQIQKDVSFSFISKIGGSFFWVFVTKDRDTDALKPCKFSKYSH